MSFYRIEEAKKRIQAEPDKLIIEIAYDVGFQSIASFNRPFKQEVAVPPSHYRKRINNLTSN